MIEITLNHPIQIPLSDENLKELRSIEPQRFFISEEPQEHDFSLMSFELSDSFNLFSTRQTVARKELIIRCLTSTARWISPAKTGWYINPGFVMSRDGEKIYI